MSNEEFDSNDLQTESCIKDMLKSKRFSYKGVRFEKSFNGSHFEGYIN
jgi:hypothetical protein